MRQQERREKIAFLTLAQIDDRWLARGSLGAAVPAEIIVSTVLIIFAVGLVMFFVVADQIVQREAVVGGDKIDAGVRLPPALAIKIAAARQAISHAADLAGVALPKTPHGVAVDAVPFRPEHREIADLITAFA